jgi:RNA polymerase sigma factor (sigma-70 family)
LIVVEDPNRTPEEEINRLVPEYQVALLRLCYAYLHDRTAAEDAVQETFLKVYRNIGRFRGDSSEKTWLMKIAVNVCRDTRRTGWFRHVNRAVTTDALPEPSTEASQRDREITAEVMRLPVKMREVVLLYYYQDMTTVETAEALGVTQQAVGGRLRRAKARLRAVLEGERTYE